MHTNAHASAIVTCPIFGNNEECIGAVQLLNYKDEAPFEPADIELLKEFILYCSGAIQQVSDIRKDQGFPPLLICHIALLLSHHALFLCVTSHSASPRCKMR